MSSRSASSPSTQLTDDDLFYFNTSSDQQNSNVKKVRALTDDFFDFHISPKILNNDDDDDDSVQISPSNKNEINPCEIDQFICYINSTLKEVSKFYDNSDPDIIRKNNNYLYYLSKLGIKCMNKN